MGRKVSIAVCQFIIRPIADFGEFAARVRSLLDEAVGADLVVFPELFTLELFTTFPGWQNAPSSELTRVDEYTEAYRDLFVAEAAERRQHIAGGSHLMRCGEVYRNVAHLFGPQGLIHTHLKTHIFPGEMEWSSTEEGDSIEVVELPFAKVGFNICSEAEIPECATSLAQQGVEIILGPSYTLSECGFWRVRHCAQARCVENQVYFVHCCTGGQHATTEPMLGGWARSSILTPCDTPWNPDGVVAQADPNKEMTVLGELDIDLIYQNRTSGTAPTYNLRRRRADLYAAWPSHVPRGRV